MFPLKVRWHFLVLLFFTLETVLGPEASVQSLPGDEMWTCSAPLPSPHGKAWFQCGAVERW